jgi:hypothetical protein
MTCGMRQFRLLLDDRLSAWLVAGLAAYVLLLQGLTTAYAKGAMADIGAVLVICAPSGERPQTDVPLDVLAKECCGALCKSACATPPGLAGSVQAQLAAPVTERGARHQDGGPRATPRQTGHGGGARAPPMLSI